MQHLYEAYYEESRNNGKGTIGIRGYGSQITNLFNTGMLPRTYIQRP